MAAAARPLTHPELYEDIGIKPPKGVILYGELGTGKTLLAKTVANSTLATFLRVVGSELIQKYLGDGLKLVREIFRVADDLSPSIVVIDEIDAVGTKRYDAHSGGEREIQRTILELLNQLDGFDSRGDVKVILATNRIESLDPALPRPGRIDRKIEFPLPDIKTRRCIFQIHTSRMTLTNDVNLEEFVMTKDEFSGVDINAICTEVGLLALRERRMKVKHPDFKKTNLVFLGDGIGKTIITGSANADQPGVTIYTSATVAVLGDGFMAKDVTFQNTAGPDAHQAVALRLDSDLAVIENCEFLGNQDTLYAHSLRQFYKSCRIVGNVDFIFGNSATIFQDCEILVRPRQVKPEKGENNAITAHGRTDPSQTTGFVFQNCLINGTEDYMALYHSNPKVHKNYLGRPWKEYSRTVFINSVLEVLVTPGGWMPWKEDFALKTLYYGEFENKGAGSDLSQRVPWSSKIPAEHVSIYSAENFIQGSEWISSSHLLAKRPSSHRKHK